MALTNEDKQELLQELLNAIKAESQSVDDLEAVESLANINSLPAMQGPKLVRAPLELLSKPATDAAAKASSAAEKAVKAADNAILATDLIGEIIPKVTSATDDATQAAIKAETAADLVENSTGFALKGSTARFSGVVDNAVIDTHSTAQPGGRIVYVRASRIFAYNINEEYYSDWDVAGTPTPDMYLNEARTEVLRDKLYLLGDSVYTATSGDLALLSYRHEILSEAEYEALSEKDADTIYMTYEDE